MYETKVVTPMHTVRMLGNHLADFVEVFVEHRATNDARLREIERKGSADVLLSLKLDKLDTRLNEFEAMNRRATLGSSPVAAAREMQAALEASFAEASLASTPGARKRVVNGWARATALCTGHPNMRKERTLGQDLLISVIDREWKALNATSDPDGGFLCPPAFVAEVLRKISETSAVRSIAKVRTGSARDLTQPTRTGAMTAQRVLEQGTRAETTGLTYGSVSVPSPEMFALVDVSTELFEDNAADLEIELRETAVEQFAVKEGSEFVTGTGVGEMTGILTHPDIASVDSGSAATVADAQGGVDGLVRLANGIKAEYAENAVWLLNRNTLSALRRLKDSTFGYIWSPGLQAGSANLILGRPYLQFHGMPDQGAGVTPIAFGDFKRGYTVYDRIFFAGLRDMFTQWSSGRVRFILRRRVGGSVALAEAIAKLRCAA